MSEAAAPWRSALPPDTVVAWQGFTPEQRANLDAVEGELQRKEENGKFKIWEAGFLAGLAAARGERPMNPYVWRGPQAT